MTALAFIALICVLSVTGGTWAHVRVQRAIQDAADMAWAETFLADLEATQVRHPAGRDITDGDFVWLWDNGVMPS